MVPSRAPLSLVGSDLQTLLGVCPLLWGALGPQGPGPRALGREGYDMGGKSEVLGAMGPMGGGPNGARQIWGPVAPWGPWGHGAQSWGV